MALLPTSYQDFKSSERSFLATFSGEQPLPLGKLATELEAHSQTLQRAYVGPLLSPSVVREYAQATVNIQVLASTMGEVHSTIDNMVKDFMQKLDLSPARSSKRAACSVASSPILSTDTLETFASPPSCSNHTKDPHELLRDWSSRHLSYLFPAKQELLDLSDQTGLSTKQVDLWFRNARTRSGWSKLFTNKLYANKDRQKLESYFAEYEVIRSLRGTKTGSVIGSDDAFTLVEKVLKWFRVKKSKDNPSIGAFPMPSVSEETGKSSVRPWVKDVLFSTLAAFRTTSPPSPTKKSYLPTLGWPNIFNRTDSIDIDPSLRSSSPESSSASAPSYPSGSSSSTWSSVSTSSSRSSSPCNASSSLSTSPQSTFSPLPPPSTASSLLAPPLPSSSISSPESLSQPTPSSPSESSTYLSPQPDTSTSLLSFLCSDSFSPPSPTHEPCTIASGQFDDAEED